MIVWISLAYLLSGFCALIYETVWIYQFSRVFGSTVFATSFVAAAFFAGLALGGEFFGKAASKSSNPLRLYAFLELGIGVYALAFPLLLSGADGIYAAGYPHVSGSLAGLTLLRLVLAGAVLLPPAMLMGGTLPVLLAHCADRLDAVSRRAGLLYGINALGASLGAFLSGFVLLKALGVSRTNALAAVINIGAGALARTLSLKVRTDLQVSAAPAAKTPLPAELPSQPIQSGQPEQPERRLPPAFIVAVFAVSGFVSMACEVVWLRYLIFYFQETIRVCSGIIAVFILGIAAGSLAGGRWAQRLRQPLAALGVLQLGTGVLTYAAVYLPVSRLRALYSAGQGSDTNVLLCLFALLFAPAVLMGAAFPVVTRILVRDLRAAGSTMGRAYAWNTAGCILGLLSSGFVLQRFLGLQMTLNVLLGLNLLLASLLLHAGRRPARPYLSALPALLFAVLILTVRLCGLQLPEAVIRQTRGRNEEMLELREGLLGITWASRGKNTREVHLWSNGVRISRGGRSTFLAQGFIPMLLAPKIPQNVLGLAFGAGLSYRGVRLFPEVRRMDFVDLSRDNIEVALRHFPENEGLAGDPRARFIIDDAYSYVKYHPAQYDLISMEPTPPRFCFQSASLYTREFYGYARQRLSPAGYFAQVLPLEDFSPEETAGTLRTFASVFPHVLLWRNGWDCIMFGSQQPFRLDVPAMAGRLNRPEIQSALRACAPAADRYYLLENFLSGLLLAEDDFRAAGAGGAIYTDENEGLRFTTGREISAENIRNIHSHLTPWPNALRLFSQYPGFEAQRKALTRKREYFMALLYKTEPPRFVQAFLRYIKMYSENKDEDLNQLIDYMSGTGLTETPEVLEYVQSLENAPESPASVIRRTKK